MTHSSPQIKAPTTPRRARSLAAALPFCYCLFLAACVKPEAPTLPAAPSATESRIMESSQRIAKAVEQLQRDQAAVTADAGRQAPPPVDPTAAPAALRMAVTWSDWKGPLDSAVRGIAERIGYRVRVNGVAPSVPVIVHIDAKDTPAIQILEDLGLQAGSRATVRLDTGSTTIHLYYTAPKMGVM